MSSGPTPSPVTAAGRQIFLSRASVTENVSPQPSLQSVPLHPLTAPPEAPPAYELPAYSDVKPVGVPVQLQLDGRTVTATLIQEVIITGVRLSVMYLGWGLILSETEFSSRIFSSSISSPHLSSPLPATREAPGVHR